MRDRQAWGCLGGIFCFVIELLRIGLGLPKPARTESYSVTFYYSSLYDMHSRWIASGVLVFIVILSTIWLAATTTRVGQKSHSTIIRRYVCLFVVIWVCRSNKKHYQTLIPISRVKLSNLRSRWPSVSFWRSELVNWLASCRETMSHSVSVLH